MREGDARHVREGSAFGGPWTLVVVIVCGCGSRGVRYAEWFGRSAKEKNRNQLPLLIGTVDLSRFMSFKKHDRACWALDEGQWRGESEGSARTRENGLERAEEGDPTLIAFLKLEGCCGIVW